MKEEEKQNPENSEIPAVNETSTDCGEEPLVDPVETVISETNKTQARASNKNKHGGSNTSSTEKTSEAESEGLLGGAGGSGSIKFSTRAKPAKTGAVIKLALAFIVVLLSAGAGAYYFWQYSQAQEAQIQILGGQLEKIKTDLKNLQQTQNNSINKINSQNASLSNRIQHTEQSLTAQQKRLLSMSTTGREDWLLAEAEYLLRLANQRVLIERSPRSAIGLLKEADNILLDLSDPELGSLRQALADDLAKLLLAKEIDREGIYFSLTALSSQVENLPLRPSRQELLAEEMTFSQLAPAQENSDLVEAEKTIWDRFKIGFTNMSSSMDGYIRVRDHATKPKPLLSPDVAVYLQQNLRIKLERAQLALFREEQKVYTSSLEEAEAWLAEYYPQSQAVLSFREQVLTIKNKIIVQPLPDITWSLKLLHDYIENLHRLESGGVKEGNK